MARVSLFKQVEILYGVVRQTDWPGADAFFEREYARILRQEQHDQMWTLQNVVPHADAA